MRSYDHELQLIQHPYLVFLSFNIYTHLCFGFISLHVLFFFLS